MVAGTDDDYVLKNVAEDGYEALCERWTWDVPEPLNLATYLCDRWARRDRDRVAVHWEHERAPARTYTFETVRQRSNRFGNALRAAGVERDSFIGVFLPTVPEHVFATLGAQKVGAVSVPLYTLFGPDGLQSRLESVSPQVLFTDPGGTETLAAIPAKLVPDTVVVVDRYDPDRPPAPGVDAVDVEAWLEGASTALDPVRTDPEDPAQLFFTSGTTGEPKGVLQPHRTVVGHEAVGRYAREYHPDDLLFHLGDLSWAGGFNNLLEAWSIGEPLLKDGGRFSARRTLELLERYDVDIFTGPPTALRRVMDLDPTEIASYDIDLRVVACGGEAVTRGLLEWAEETFDAFATNMWGQTECYGIGWPALGDRRHGRLGTVGKELPGFEATVLDESGTELPPGEPGQLAVRRANNPTMFTGYHDDPAATAAARSGPWHLTGDAATVDEDGYFFVHGRMDDVIISSGYRLSPSEIEATLREHPAVDRAGVRGVEDERKTNRIVSYVTLEAGHDGDDALREGIQRFVRERLAAFQYPNEVVFVEALPRTVTGKLKRSELGDR